MAYADISNKDTYFVAVKLFLERGGKLFIFKDKWNDWDFPGGRIRKDEFDVPLESIIARKMKEEIGDGVAYTLGKPIVLMRHERQEATAGQTVRIFAVGYSAILTDGEPRLGDHHVEMKWVDVKDFKPEEYFTGGWLKGVQEYLAIKNS
jgi:8-oxo-dGTP pyrophosphatase MutT (NUDIX family)